MLEEKKCDESAQMGLASEVNNTFGRRSHNADSEDIGTEAIAEPSIPRGKFANSSANTEELKALVLEEAEYLGVLSKRIEELIDSQQKLAKKIELNARTLGVLPSLARGMALGFGIVIGSTVIVGLFVYLLTRAETIPIVGDFVKRIIDYIQLEQLSK